MRAETDKAKLESFAMKTSDLSAGLPGENLVLAGLADLQAGQCTIPACLVAMARPRLSHTGLLSPTMKWLPAEPELELYRLLRKAGGDAYSNYYALLRQLVSFEQALDRRYRAVSAIGLAAEGRR